MTFKNPVHLILRLTFEFHVLHFFVKMKLIPYSGSSEWKNGSFVKEEEEKKYENLYQPYLQASEWLDKTIDHFFSNQSKQVEPIVQACEKMLGEHLAHPIVVSHPCVLSRNGGYHQFVKNMKYSFSAVVNDGVVQRSWTSGELQQNMEELLSYAVEIMDVDVSFKDFCQKMEDKITSLGLFPVSDTYGYEATKNIPLTKNSTNKMVENGVYVVRIQVKERNLEPNTFSRGSEYFIFTDKKVPLKLHSSKKILFDLRNRKKFGFCSRHVKHIQGHLIGLKDLLDKGIINEVPLVMFDENMTGEITRTVILKPTSKLML